MNAFPSTRGLLNISLNSSTLENQITKSVENVQGMMLKIPDIDLGILNYHKSKEII